VSGVPPDGWPLPRGGFVFFDVGGTLVEVYPSVGDVYARVCRERGAAVEARAVQQAFDRAWVRLSQDVPRGADRYALFPGGEREWWERVSALAFELCGVAPERRPSIDDLRGHFARPEAWRIYPEAREALRMLRMHGYRLGILSNWDSRLPRLLDALDLKDEFEVITYSAAAGCEKPNPAIFCAALKAAGVAASRAAHVGDRLEEDYEGARAAGMRGLLLAREGASPAEQPGVERCDGAGDLVADLGQAADRIAGRRR
jgi:putative hydrolase of the HAD superfamily